MAVLVVMGFVLAACSSPQAASSTPTAATEAGLSDQGNNDSPARPISIEGKLEVGTLDLEDTDQAVTAAEAKQLLPLWQQIKTLSTDPNTSASDLSAVITQIQQTMTSDQITAINAMNLTQSDEQSEMDELGIPTSQNGGSNPNGTPGFHRGFNTILMDAVINMLTQRASE